MLQTTSPLSSIILALILATVGQARASTNDAPSLLHSDRHSNRHSEHCLHLISQGVRDQSYEWVCRTAQDQDGSAGMILIAPQLPRVAHLNGVDRQIESETLRLFHSKFPAGAFENFLWSGVESANPLTKDGLLRWNSLREAGLYDHERRQVFIQQLLLAHFKTLRIGIPNHEIFQLPNGDWDAFSWRNFDAIIDDLSNAGISISLDLHHFGIEDRFKKTSRDGQDAPLGSFYLNPQWPDYFAAFAIEAYRRYYKKISAVTIINEPETTVGFQGEMWNGAFPGWGDARNSKIYIDRAVNVAIAAVKARTEIERFIRTSRDPRARLPFVHTEAVQAKTDGAIFNRFSRFLVSDLILGAPWLVRLPVKENAIYNSSETAFNSLRDVSPPSPSLRTTPTQTLSWLRQSYTRSLPLAERDAALAKLSDRLRILQALHLRLRQNFGVSMRSFTVFGGDYYSQNESYENSNPATTPQSLEPDPRLYADQVLTKRRQGFARLMQAYYERYQMPMMVSETGTVYNDFAAGWLRQILLERGELEKAGVPIVAVTAYPIVDTFGWESALAKPRAESVLNPSGLFTLDFQPRAALAPIRRDVERLWRRLD